MAQPSQPSDAITALNAGVQEGFAANQVPSSFGYGTRQSRLPNNRVATDQRHIIHWLVPEGPIVQMYINPQQIVINDKKTIISNRSKGGFILQYWGEELTPISLNGTTGSSGIEGINVLHDLYRNEQLAFDPYALYLESQVNNQTLVGNIFGENSALTAGQDFVSALIGGAQSLIPSANQAPPSLASMAFTVEMYYSGKVYRGYFENMSVTESVSNMGMFDYQISFIATQTRGFRQNYMSWHRSATSGPSHTDPYNGIPYSFNSLVDNTNGIPNT